MLSGEIERYELDKRYVRPDGWVVWVHILVARLAFGDEDQLNHISIVVDITAQKQTEEALRESERSKSVLLSHLPGMAYRCKYDRDWTMLFVSDGCLQLTGYPPESLLDNRQLSFNDLILPEYRDELWQEWANDLAGQSHFKHEYEIMTASGGRKWVLEMGQGVFNEQGEVTALEGIVFDISTRKIFERRLKYSSEHDRLTGLYNYDFLENLLERDLKAAAMGIMALSKAGGYSVMGGVPGTEGMPEIGDMSEIGPVCGTDDMPGTGGVPENRAVVSLNLTSIHALTAVYGYRYTQDLLKGIVETLQGLVTKNRLLFSTFENRFVFYVRGYADFLELDTFCDVLAETMRERLAAEGIGCGIGVVEIHAHKYTDADEILKNLMNISEIAVDMREKDLRVCYFDDRVESLIHREQVIRRELMAICAGDGEGTGEVAGGGEEAGGVAGGGEGTGEVAGGGKHYGTWYRNQTATIPRMVDLLWITMPFSVCGAISPIESVPYSGALSRDWIFSISIWKSSSRNMAREMQLNSIGVCVSLPCPAQSFAMAREAVSRVFLSPRRM
jgi:PAS domain S-box-containing protein